MPFWETLFEGFSNQTLAWIVQHTHTHTDRSADQCKHKLNGKERLHPVKFCFSPDYAPVLLSCSLIGLSVLRGSWAWSVKIKQTLMKWTMEEQRGLLSTDGRNPVTLRGENVTVSYWPEWPGSLLELQHTLFREEETIGSHWYSAGAGVNTYPTIV